MIFVILFFLGFFRVPKSPTVKMLFMKNQSDDP